MGLLGQTAMMPPTATVKMSKLQMVQVYAASVMFGYFLRRVDKRFQLARTLDMLPESKEDSVQRLERLFSLVRVLALLPISVPFFAACCSSARRTP